MDYYVTRLEQTESMNCEKTKHALQKYFSLKNLVI